MANNNHARQRRSVIREYEKCTQEVRKYFEHLPALINGFPLDVCLSYMFARLERAQNAALYCGVVRLHKANADVAWKALSEYHIMRNDFRKLYRTIFSFDPSPHAQKGLELAERTRDMVMHGKNPDEASMREAITIVLKYAEAMNLQLAKLFKPFGNLRGFAGRAKKLDKTTTRFMLKGIGFPLS